MRKKENKFIMTRRRWAAFTVVLTILFITTQYMPEFISSLTPKEVLKYGELVVSEKRNAIVVREDVVYRAKRAYRLKRKSEAGTQIKVGAKLFQCKPLSGDKSQIKKRAGSCMMGEDGRAKHKGVFSTVIDGGEEFFTPDNIPKITKKNADDVDMKLRRLEAKDVGRGEPICKISDNARWYIIFWTSKTAGKVYKKENIVDAEIKGKILKSKIEDVSPDGESVRVVLSTSRYYRGFQSLRRIDLKLIRNRRFGILIKNSCMYEEGGTNFVDVLNKAGDIIKTPVKVLATDGKTSAVSSGKYYDSKGRLVETVENFDDILKNPKGK